MKQSLKEYQKFINECEAAIQQGLGDSCHKKLITINTAKVPTTLRFKMANICRRVGLIDLALRILSPRVHKDKMDFNLDSSDDELMEYAILLQRTGMISESQTILGQIDSRLSPKALLYQAFGLFKNWNHHQAISYLESYVKNEINEYDLLIGQLNLALAYCISNKLDQSFELAGLCAETARMMGKNRLYGNCLELQTQIHILKDQNTKALACLTKANSCVPDNFTFDRLYIEKWYAYFDCLKEKSLVPLQDFKKRAFEEASWEDVRESDLFMARLNLDDGRILKHLTFGSPSEGYQMRIQNITGKTIDTSYGYLLGGRSKNIINLYDGTFNGEVTLPVGKKTHQLLELLSRDFYRPLKIGEIFAELYKGEYYSAISSPNRVQKLISRTKKNIVKPSLPIKIVQKNGFYKIDRDSSVSLFVPYRKPELQGPRAYLRILKNHFSGDLPFLSSEAQDHLGLKEGKTREILNYALNEGTLVRIGQGSGSSYKFIA